MARACMAGSTLLVPFQRAFSFSFSTPMISVFNRWISLVLFTGTGFNPSNVFFNLRTTPLHRASSRSPSSVSRSPAACFLVCVAWICSWWRRTKKKRKKEQGKKKTFPTRKTSERTVSHRLMKQEKVVHQDQYHTVPPKFITPPTTHHHHPPPPTTTTPPLTFNRAISAVLSMGMGFNPFNVVVNVSINVLHRNSSWSDCTFCSFTSSRLGGPFFPENQ
jgi:hypothetical protein